MDLALLKTVEPIRDARNKIIPLCTQVSPESEHHYRMYGAAGMGSTSTSVNLYQLSVVLHETFFFLSKYKTNSEHEMCRADNVCTRPRFIEGSICHMDQGGPLYKFHCGSLVPECLYGVASYWMTNPELNSNETCNGGSYFASVPVFYNWINYHLNNYANRETKKLIEMDL